MTNDAEIVHSPETLLQMQADAVLADEVRAISSALRQAVHGLQHGLYETFEDAMAAICGFRPVMVECPTDGAPRSWDSVVIEHRATPLSD